MASSATPAATAGIFDSGVGGLTVVAAIRSLLPGLPLRYIADTAYFPYGERSERAVGACAELLAARLVDGGCALLVVACNTASSAALEQLRARFALPIVGMEPPLKPAAEQSGSGRVAVLVTPATARGDRLARLTDAFGMGVEVETLPMPGLAELVEAGEIAGPRVEGLLRDALDGPLARGADRIALGCTHYGFLRATLERLLPPGVAVVDAAMPVAQRVRQQLAAYGITIEEGDEATIDCVATGAPAAFEATIQRLRTAGAELPPLHAGATRSGAV